MSAASGRFPGLFPIRYTVLVLCAVVYNALTGKRYPHPQHSYKGAGSARFVSADLDAALSHYNQVLDVSRADLEGLLHLAGRAACQRILGAVR